MPYPTFDRSRLRIQSLANRDHDLDLSVLLPLDAPQRPDRESNAEPGLQVGAFGDTSRDTSALTTQNSTARTTKVMRGRYCSIGGVLLSS